MTIRELTELAILLEARAADLYEDGYTLEAIITLGIRSQIMEEIAEMIVEEALDYYFGDDDDWY